MSLCGRWFYCIHTKHSNLSHADYFSCTSKDDLGEIKKPWTFWQKLCIAFFELFQRLQKVKTRQGQLFRCWTERWSKKHNFLFQYISSCTCCDSASQMSHRVFCYSCFLAANQTQLFSSHNGGFFLRWVSELIMSHKSHVVPKRHLSSPFVTTPRSSHNAPFLNKVNTHKNKALDIDEILTRKKGKKETKNVSNSNIFHYAKPNGHYCGFTCCVYNHNRCL